VREVQHAVPVPPERVGVGRRTIERERLNLLARVPTRASRLREDTGRTKAGVLPAGCPRQIAERLESAVALDYVDPIAGLQPTDQRQDLVRGEVERMQGEA
jgi:hypothetical protein